MGWPLGKHLKPEFEEQILKGICTSYNVLQAALKFETDNSSTTYTLAKDSTPKEIELFIKNFMSNIGNINQDVGLTDDHQAMLSAFIALVSAYNVYMNHKDTVHSAADKQAIAKAQSEARWGFAKEFFLGGASIGAYNSTNLPKKLDVSNISILMGVAGTYVAIYFVPGLGAATFALGAMRSMYKARDKYFKEIYKARNPESFALVDLVSKYKKSSSLLLDHKKKTFKATEELNQIHEKLKKDLELPDREVSTFSKIFSKERILNPNRRLYNLYANDEANNHSLHTIAPKTPSTSPSSGFVISGVELVASSPTTVIPSSAKAASPTNLMNSYNTIAQELNTQITAKIKSETERLVAAETTKPISQLIAGVDSPEFKDVIEAAKTGDQTQLKANLAKLCEITSPSTPSKLEVLTTALAALKTTEANELLVRVNELKLPEIHEAYQNVGKYTVNNTGDPIKLQGGTGIHKVDITMGVAGGGFPITCSGDVTEQSLLAANKIVEQTAAQTNKTPVMTQCPMPYDFSQISKFLDATPKVVIDRTLFETLKYDPDFNSAFGDKYKDRITPEPPILAKNTFI